MSGTGGWRFSPHNFSSLSTTCQMTMGTAPVPPLPMWRRDRADAAVDSDAEDESRDKRNGYVFFCPFVLPILLFFSLFFFPALSFAPPPFLCSGGIGPTRASTATRRTRGQTGPTGTYSFVFLFFLLSSSSHSSSFRLSLLPRSTTMSWGGTGRDQREWQQKHGAGRERNGCVFCFFWFVYSLLFFFLP